MIGVIAGAASAKVVVHRDGDTTQVRRIRIDENGVRVEKGGDGRGLRIETRVDPGHRVIRIDDNGDTLFDSDDDADGTIHIGNGHISFDSDNSDRVRMFSDIEIAKDEEIDGDVVSLFGSVDVHGRVTGNVVAVLGSVRMHPGARIDGDAVAVGGGLDQPAGAQVGGESVSVGFLQWTPGIPPLAILLVTIVCCFVLSVVAGWLLWLVFPGRMVRVAITASRSTGWSLMLGILFPPLAVIAAVLLSITVIGLPLAFLLPVACLVIAWAGQVATTYLVGSRLLRRPLGVGNPIGPIVAGSLVVAVLFALGALLAGPQGFIRSLALFPLALGLLVTTVMGTIGAGAVLRSMFGTRPFDTNDLDHTPSAMPTSNAPPSGPTMTAMPPAV
jgi:hypothetical protein